MAEEKQSFLGRLQATGQDIVDSSIDSVKKFGADIFESVSAPNFDPVQKNGSLYYFPKDLVSADEALRPVIRFTCFERTGKSGGPERHRQQPGSQLL